MRSGKLSPEEAESHPQRSVITRALGTEPDVDVDTFTVEAEPGDLFLLCSDGLTDMVPTREIQALLADRPTTSTPRPARSSTPRTPAAARTTSPSSSSRSPAARHRPRRWSGPSRVAPEPEAEDDDEDTLSGLEPVPAVDTAVISAERSRSSCSSSSPSRSLRLRRATPTAAPPARRR